MALVKHVSFRAVLLAARAESDLQTQSEIFRSSALCAPKKTDPRRSAARLAVLEDLNLRSSEMLSAALFNQGQLDDLL